MWTTDTGYIPDTLAQFLGRVVPWAPGTYVNLHGKTPDSSSKVDYRRKGGGDAYESMAEYGQMLQFITRLNRDGDEGFFCLSSRSAHGGITATGRKKASRQKGVSLPVWLRSFVLDLDVKPTGYPTQRAALRAALGVLDKLGLKHGPITMTGGGFHVFITLAEPIRPEIWRPLAAALVEAVKANGLKCDAGVTKDDDRFLRLPTTYNRKTDTPRLCSVIEPLGSLTTLAELEAAVAQYRGLTPEVGHSSSQVVLDPKIFPPRRPITYGPVFAEVSAAIAKNRVATTADDLIAACPVVASSEARGGAGDPEPLWKELATLCHYVEDGRDFFHDLSSADHRYVEEQADAKFSERSTLGWPHCSTIAQTCDAARALCAGCQFNGQHGKSPIHHARELRAATLPPVPTPQPYVNGYVNGATEGAPNPFAAAAHVIVVQLPQQYIQTPDGHIREAQTNKDVFGWPIEKLDYRYGKGLGVTFPLGLTGTRSFDTRWIGGAELSSEQTARSKLSDCLPFKDFKLMRAFTEDFTTMIRRQREIRSDNRPGWSKNDGMIVGFNYGGDTYGEDYTPRGSLAEWQRVLNQFVGKGCVEVEVAIAAAFASPLTEMSAVEGTLLHFRSAGTGMGKSACCELSASVWGSRDTVLKFGTSLASMAQSAEANNLPTYLDEAITGSKNSRANLNLAREILQRSAGQERDRLNRGAALIKGRTWKSMTVSASNFSLVETASVADTNAQAARIFEITMTDAIRRLALHHQVADIKEALNLNRGQAGLVYAQFLNERHAVAKAILRTVELEFIKATGFGEAERFWLATATTLYAGASIAKGLGILPFDLKTMKAFLLTQLRAQRLRMDTMGTDASDPKVQLARVIDFVNTNRLAILLTKQMPRKGNNTPQFVDNLSNLSRERQIAGRMATVDKVLELSEAQLQKWCERREQDFSFNEMRLVLVKAGYCTLPHRALSLSRLTNLQPPMGSEKLLRFDLSAPQNEPFLSVLDDGGDDVGDTVSSGAQPSAAA